MEFVYTADGFNTWWDFWRPHLFQQAVASALLAIDPEHEATPEEMQAGHIPTDDAGQPFKYLQMAPLPVYQAKMPSLDKAIFSIPGMKRKREGKGPRQPRFKKAAVKPKPSASAHPPPSESPDNSSHSQEHEDVEEESSHEQSSPSPMTASGRTDEEHSAEANPP